MALKVKTLKFVEMNEVVNYMIYHKMISPNATASIEYTINCFFTPGEFYPAWAWTFLSIIDLLKVLRESNVEFYQDPRSDARLNGIAVLVPASAMSASDFDSVNKDELKIKTMIYVNAVDLCWMAGGNKLSSMYHDATEIDDDGNRFYYRSSLDCSTSTYATLDLVTFEDFTTALRHATQNNAVKEMFETVNINPNIYVEIE